MWLEVDRSSFEVRQQGLDRRPAPAGGHLYVSPGRHLDSAKDLVDAEYCQAVEVDPHGRTVSFGRDYLGHYPMIYAQARGKLFISDEPARVRGWLTGQGVALTLSEEAVALYFAMGYVPQGMTLHNEIKTCRNASLYHWKAGQITSESTFAPVAPDPRFPLAELGARIDAGIEEILETGKPVDVWCSGGLDSSIVATVFGRHGNGAELLTLTYDELLQSDASELRFAEDLSKHLGATLRHAPLTRENFCDTFREYASTHIGPAVDYVVPLKYALAKATRRIGVTGEGGDPLFSGAKNNFIVYLRGRHRELSLGKVYAMAHKRLYECVPEILKHGAELSGFVDSYLGKILDSYPGDLLRKLFYVNTLEKQGGMIFPKNYYAGRSYRVEVFHPLTALEVYRAAFSLPDERKYVYPSGKLALIELYKNELPKVIVDRRKSGTRLPLEAYVSYLVESGMDLDILKDTGFFREEKLDRLLKDCPRRREELVLLYGLLSLSAWLGYNGSEAKPEGRLTTCISTSFATMASTAAKPLL